MKYLKYVLFGFLFMFLFNIDVLAEADLVCKYTTKVSAVDKIDITITFENGEGKVESIITRSSSIIINVNLAETLSKNSFCTSSGELSCPVLYFAKIYNTSGREVTYNFSVNGTEEDYTRLDAYDSEINEDYNCNSSTGNVDDSETSIEIIDTCTYVSKQGIQVFSFDITTEGPINHTFFGNVNNNTQYLNPELVGTGYDHCPTYINTLCLRGYCSITGSDEKTSGYNQWYYYGSGLGADGQNKDFVAVYLPINLGNTSKAIIMKSETSSYRAVFDYEEITIDGVGNYFLSDNTENYPTYLVETLSGYSFSFEKPETYKNIYILYERLFEAKTDGKLTNTCQIIIGNDFLEFLNNNVFRVIYIGIPIILILLTSFDFAKVVFINDKEGIQKAGKRFGKRVIVAVLIFLVPTILIFISNLIGVESIDDCVKQLEQIVEEESS